MICQLFIITIIINNSSNGFTGNYLLITACVVIALTHHIFKPYFISFLNVFDGAVLQLMILVSVLQLVELSDGFDSNLVTGIVFTLVALPLVSFLGAKVLMNKRKIKRLIGYWYFRCSNFQLRLRNYNEIPLEDTETPPNEVGVIVDDTRRINATICDV